MTTLREALASLEHEQWTKWSQAIANSEPITTQRRHRWAGFWRPYEELPEIIKDEDREWADKVLVLCFGEDAYDIGEMTV